jgi:acetyltransferase-like isoleucine patch superfamily enzyme
MRGVRIFLAILISLLPINALRVWAYRRILGYHMRNAFVGFGTVIAVDRAIIQNCKIGLFNLFLGPARIVIKDGASMGNENRVVCGFWVLKQEYAGHGYSRTFEVAENSLITSNHYFDVVGTFKLGQRSWIAGIGSQFWTHGAGNRDQRVEIGSDCYVGSAVRFSPDSSIGNNVILSLGSVVTRAIPGDHLMVGGVPAGVLQENYDWRTRVA